MSNSNEIKAGTIRQSYGDTYSATQLVMDMQRMCVSFVQSCIGCPLYKCGCNPFLVSFNDDSIAAVRQWAAEHPQEADDDKR